MRRKHLVAVHVFWFGLTVIPGLYRLQGFDFDKRGDTAVYCAVTMLIVSIGGTAMAVTWPDSE